MIKALSLAAALALLPLSAALAQNSGQDTARSSTGSAEAELEAAAAVFEARMETFGARAGALEADESLTHEAREAAMVALWAEYEPAVTEFTAFATQQAGLIAAQAMADIDMEALVEEALADVDLSALANMTNNGAWASQDPEHLETYGLIADYAIGAAEDAVAADAEAAQADAEAARADAEAAIAGPAPAPHDDTGRN